MSKETPKLGIEGLDSYIEGDDKEYLESLRGERRVDWKVYSEAKKKEFEDRIIDKDVVSNLKYVVGRVGGI